MKKKKNEIILSFDMWSCKVLAMNFYTKPPYNVLREWYEWYVNYGAAIGKLC